jgi:hypothetical protein
MHPMQQYTFHTKIFDKFLSVGVIFHSPSGVEFPPPRNEPLLYSIEYHQKRSLFVSCDMKCNVDHLLHIAMFIVFL